MAGAVTDGPPGDAFELVASRQQLAEGVGRMAEAIESDHPDGVTLVAVLKGASVLVADLSRLLRVPVHIEFLAIAPFDGTNATEGQSPIAVPSSSAWSGRSSTRVMHTPEFRNDSSRRRLARIS